MGTSFDEFNEKAFTMHFENKNKAFHNNRMILKKSLENAGFVNYPEEWWHFSYGDQHWAEAKNKDYAIYGSMEL